MEKIKSGRNLFGVSFLLLLLTCFVAKALGEEQTAVNKMVPEIRYSSGTPVIEGKENEAAWKNADVLTGFTEPKSLNIARDQSEVRVLFDDKNIYFNLKALESSKDPVECKKDVNVFAADNFEIFIQPDVDSAVYYQIAVSPCGNTYAARNRSTAWTPEIKVKTDIGKGFWSANLSIPLSDLGISAPPMGKERKMRCNVARSDATGINGKAEASSLALLDIWDYHVGETWPEMLMVRNSSTAPRMIANKSPLINLLVNPEFNFAENGKPVGWEINENEGVSRQEAMALSGEWIIRATGNSYLAFRQNIKLEAGKEYTLKVKARRFGEDGAFGVIQMVKTATGGLKEGAYSGWQIPLTAEFREYNIPVVAAEGLASIVFYRLGARTNTAGADFASIRLFEGKSSAFEIRKVSRNGGKRVVKGTELSCPANIFGVKGEKLKVLAVMRQLAATRECMDMFSGLNIEYDILTATGKDQDVYYTETDPALIIKRLEDSHYDLYMIGRSFPEGVGKELAGKMSENVKKGAGLLINSMTEKGNFKELLEKYKPVPVGEIHYLKMGFPSALCPAKVSPTGKIMEVNADRGRIVLAETTIKSWEFEFRIALENDAYGSMTFPSRKYSDAWLARLVYYTAGKNTPSIKGISFNNGVCAVVCGGGSILKWQLEDKNGNLVSKGTSELKDSQATIEVPKMTLAGDHVMSFWLLGKDGSVQDYCIDTIKNEGAGITACESKKESYAGDEDAEFTIKAKGVTEGMSVAWALEDFSGRILVSGSVKAVPETALKVPLKSVYTNLARLWVRLKNGDKELDAQRFSVYLRDRDRKRLWNDFTPSIWPSGENPDTSPFIAAQMERIGIRSYLMPHHGPAVILAEGIGVGGVYRGGGDYFCALNPPKDNIRRPSLSDPEILKSLQRNVTAIAKKESRYGVVSTAICDEPNDSSPVGKDEVDAHPENLKEYRNRMKAKYGSIETFNKRCSTSYKGFDEIGLIFTKDARSRENFAEFIEWRNYNVDRWCEALRLVSESSRTVDPDSPPMSLYNSFGQQALGGNDYWKLLNNAGLDFSHEYTSMVYMGDNPLYDFDEFYRSFRPDMRLWGFIGYRWSKNHASFQPWWFALHRYSGFCWYAATSGVGAGGGGQWLNLLDVPSFGLTEDAQQLQEGLAESKLSDGMGKLFLEYDWKKRDIAVLYSQPSLLVTWCRSTEISRAEFTPGSPYNEYFVSRHKVRYMLEELLFQYDFIAPEQIRKGALDSYKILILPHIEALSEVDVRLINDFVAKGGILVADIMPGTYDELGTKRKEQPFDRLKGGGKFVVFEKTFNDKDSSQREKMLRLLDAGKAEPVVRCDDVVSTYGREAMHFVKDNMHVYAITRNFTRSDDSKNQKFTFPSTGHLYDLREGKYIGKVNEVACATPNAGTKVYGHYPYKVTGMDVACPAKLKAGEDLSADIKVSVSEGKPGYHVLHIEVMPFEGNARWFMKRNLPAPEGRTKFVFRMAENDQKGKWTLCVTDMLSGTKVIKNFMLE